MRARTLQFTAPRELRLVERELDEPQPGELLVRTLYSGISSGTELLAYRGEIDPDLALDDTIESLRGTFSYPFSFGYSCVGIVERSAHEIAPGTLVFAFHPHQDLFVCAGADALRMTHADARIATMFPFVETAFQIALDAGDVLAETVVLMGLGSVGLLTALLLQRRGAQVIGVDPVEARRDLARELDVAAVSPGELGAGLGGGGVPLVVEVSGNPAALESALPLLAHEGTVLVGSWYGTKPVTLPLGRHFHRRRLTIRSTQVSTIPARLGSRWTIERRRDAAAALLAELPLKKLATHEFPFERAADAFAALDRGDGTVVHAALSYRRG